VVGLLSLEGGRWAVLQQQGDGPRRIMPWRTEHDRVAAPHAHCQGALAHSLQRVLHLEPAARSSDQRPSWRGLGNQTTATHKWPSGEKTVMARS
jgi:hypothetical protein